MVIEGSHVLVLSCVERAAMKSWEWVTTSSHLPGDCGDMH